MELKLVAAVFATGLLCACAPTAEESVDAEPEQAKIIAMPVEIQLASSSAISHFYQTTALLEAPQEAQVVARVSGMVEEIHAEEGDNVQAGQLLASIDPKHYRLALNKAQAELDVIDQELARMQAIANKQLVSEEAMAKLSYRRQSALADRDLAQLNLQYSQVSSPINGVVAKRQIDRGNMATEMATNLFHVVQQQQLHAIIHLPEQEISNVALNQLAKLQIDGLAHSHNAKVLRIAPTVDSASGTIKVTLAVPNQHGQLRSGMLAKAKLQFDTHMDATVMPRNALLRQDNGHAVFVISNNKAQIRNVTLGYSDNGQVEVLSGVDAGEQVVIRGQHQLKDDADVEVVNTLRLAAKD
ncbi:efflux RND transporter periplasmic adaptor subunit [uncultured Ferrimonas sp.]|uniref:efflux RND transporter periplasmic adaptor subunit n=1 Tax=uncultured Ferrimonas sp. TaxID=432640 RepID=UPI00263072B3|nr:efflux RND transporter periplasmic adaptor subunit [uncultured Ferrimonas sp.]